MLERIGNEQLYRLKIIFLNSTFGGESTGTLVAEVRLDLEMHRVEVISNRVS